MFFGPEVDMVRMCKENFVIGESLGVEEAYYGSLGGRELR
jgi:hypothetical protein